MSTPLEKAVDQVQANLTSRQYIDYDPQSWEIYVGNQMQIILDAARADALAMTPDHPWAIAHEGIPGIIAVKPAEARADALDVETLRKPNPRGNWDVGWNAALDAILAERRQDAATDEAEKEWVKPLPTGMPPAQQLNHAIGDAIANPRPTIGKKKHG